MSENQIKYPTTVTIHFILKKTNKRLARQNLLSCIENGKFSEIEKIEQGISRCIKEKIPETDSDIENAQRKVEVLKIKKGNFEFQKMQDNTISVFNLIVIIIFQKGKWT